MSQLVEAFVVFSLDWIFILTRQFIVETDNRRIVFNEIRVTLRLIFWNSEQVIQLSICFIKSEESHCRFLLWLSCTFDDFNCEPLIIQVPLLMNWLWRTNQCWSLEFGWRTSEWYPILLWYDFLLLDSKFACKFSPFQRSLIFWCCSISVSRVRDFAY